MPLLPIANSRLTLCGIPNGGKGNLEETKSVKVRGCAAEGESLGRAGEGKWAKSTKKDIRAVSLYRVEYDSLT